MKAASRLFALVVLGYALSSGSMQGAVRVLLGVLALALVHPSVETRTPWMRGVYLGLLGVLGASALLNWAAAPNHHWVMTYVSLAFALHLGPRQQVGEAGLRLSLARLLAGLMTLAVLQKLISPSYLDGSYFAHIIDTGALGGPAFEFCSPCAARAELNVEAIIEFLHTPPDPAARLEMAPVVGPDTRGVWRLGRGLALSVLLVELWLACVYALAAKRVAAPLSILAFTLGLMLTRSEWVFASLVCALAFAASEPEQRRVRAALAVVCIVFIMLRLASV